MAEKSILRKVTSSVGIALSAVIIVILVSPFLNIHLSDYKKDNSMVILPGSTDTTRLTTFITALGRETSTLKRRVALYTPSEPYLVISTSDNEFELRSSVKVLREGFCSTGSYTLLHAGDEQKWIFRTPKGMLRVRGKQENPVWRKPDWAFIEEGLPVPPAGSDERYEYGVLGEYALDIGNGYLLHGTLYKRYLGMPVTHGCVRLGDEDLENIYRNLRVGSKVFIY